MSLFCMKMLESLTIHVHARYLHVFLLPEVGEQSHKGKGMKKEKERRKDIQTGFRVFILTLICKCKIHRV